MTDTMVKEETAAQVPAVRNGVGKNAPVALPELDLTLPAAVSMLQKSGMFGKSMTYEQAVAKAMIGRSMGMEPVEALRMIDVFDGNISIRSEYRAKCIKKSGANYKVTDHTDEKCSITFFGADGNEAGQHTFTMQDAQLMGLLGKDNWKKNPRVMLFWRCLSQGQRMYLPDALGTQGIYDEDEMEEIRRAKREDREETREAAKALTEHVMAAATATTPDGTMVNTATGEVIEGEETRPATEPVNVSVRVNGEPVTPADGIPDITDPFANQGGDGTLKM